MTKGLVVVLGSCGRNFAAGMSGGIAFVFDEGGSFVQKRCNQASVDLEPLTETQDVFTLRALITRHRDLTGSPRAGWILDNWRESLSRFVKVFPHEYRRVLRSRPVMLPAAHAAETTSMTRQVLHG